MHEEVKQLILGFLQHSMNFFENTFLLLFGIQETEHKGQLTKQDSVKWKESRITILTASLHLTGVSSTL